MVKMTINSSKTDTIWSNKMSEGTALFPQSLSSLMDSVVIQEVGQRTNNGFILQNETKKLTYTGSNYTLKNLTYTDTENALSWKISLNLQLNRDENITLNPDYIAAGIVSKDTYHWTDSSGIIYTSVTSGKYLPISGAYTLIQPYMYFINDHETFPTGAQPITNFSLAIGSSEGDKMSVSAGTVSAESYYAIKNASTISETLQVILDGSTEALSLDISKFSGGTLFAVENGLQILEGTSFNDKITSGNTNDKLDGQAGNDVLTGGSGDDVYLLDTKGDKVIEKSNGGIDTVITSADCVLGGNVETLQATGNAIKLTGNSSNNTIIGNSSNNTIDGGNGDDRIIGSGGADSIKGGNGADTFVYASGDDSLLASMDSISNFSRKSGDKIDLSLLLGVAFEDLLISSGAKTNEAIITIDTDGNGNTDFGIDLFLVGITPTDLNTTDFIFAVA